jgi:DNA (cytosine-5)-methyltransferase 1
MTSDVANTLKASGKGGGRTNDHEQTMVVAVAENQRGELRETSIAPALSSGGGKIGQGYSAVRDEPRIRRLTPSERERLMGAPDGWTNLHGPSLADAPLTYPTADRSPVDLKPDGRREAATGDGVAVPVAEWIAHRILLITGD